MRINGQLMDLLPRLGPAMIRSPLASSTVPPCSHCLRRWMQGFSPVVVSRQQTRGKKSRSSSSSSSSRVKVRLLQDVVSYGPKGAIVSIAPGRMRNEWFPQRIADYVPKTELRSVDGVKPTFRRDRTFGRIKEEPAEKMKEEEEAEEEDEEEEVVVGRVVKPKVLSTKHIIELLTQLLPPVIQFYRTPMPRATPPPPAPGDDAAAQAALEALAKKRPREIYGSLSAFDIAITIRTLFAIHDEASKIPLMAKYITFEAVDESGRRVDRLKHFGEFGIRIRIDKTHIINRTVRILPEAGSGYMWTR